MLQPLQSDGQFLHRSSIAAADKALAAGAEGRAGNGGYLLCQKELLAEGIGIQTGGTDAGEHVEGALRLKALQADVPEALKQELVLSLPDGEITALFDRTANLYTAYLASVRPDCGTDFRVWGNE